MIKKNKKGQWISDFFWTYGWVLIIIIVAVSFMVFYGILIPENIMPKQKITHECCVDYCFGLGDYVCSGFKSNMNNPDERYIKCMREGDLRLHLDNGSITMEDSIIYYIHNIEKVCGD